MLVPVWRSSPIGITVMVSGALSTLELFALYEKSYFPDRELLSSSSLESLSSQRCFRVLVKHGKRSPTNYKKMVALVVNCRNRFVLLSF